MIHNQFNIKTVFINFLDDSVKNAQLGFWQSIFRIAVESLVGLLNTKIGPTQSTVIEKGMQQSSIHSICTQIITGPPIFLHIFRIHSHPSACFITSSMTFLSITTRREPSYDAQPTYHKNSLYQEKGSMQSRQRNWSLGSP